MALHQIGEDTHARGWVWLSVFWYIETWNALEFQNKYIIISPGRHNTPSTYSSAGVVVLNSFDINNNNISNKYSNKANIPSFFGTSLVLFLSRFVISSHFLADPIQHIRIGCRGGAEGKVSRSPLFANF